MAISRLTTWSSGQVLFANALNSEFNNIIDNALSLISPLTATLNVNNNQLTSLRLENRTTNPTLGQTGGLWFRTDLNAPVMDTGGSAAYVPALISLALGTLIVARGATGYGALTVGANGTALLADAAATLGVRWGNAGDPLYSQVFS